ncbi:MAG: hypothetical protein EAZ78_21435 [Oscillatoriales cyanobacterium]|uniref:hypothetical protein n=1 Tax=Microcoleus anatoxicus TaxID=2705319 RepID=UPI0029765BA5|nr:MAG: hypothetical protein EAZ78_21435 [Oscillatoriales cyanobacterium]TAF44731.1 MAG: hypothetical protein EAZ68_05970 [Oscillatoriales cyanobacterium]TAF70023.1 MAG: hypothetical protein EAZ59_06335 [Oscillatoriales cyanobacterium]
MQSKLYPLAILGTTLMVTLTTQSSVAFNITGPTESYVPSVLAPVGNKRIDVLLEPKSIKSIKLGGTNGLLNVLRRAFPSWTFLRAPKEKELKGSFEIKTYKACGPLTPCQPGLETPQIGGVGAYLSLDYNPVGDDPNPVTERVYWIQRVKSNHKGGSVIHGTVENIIDINPGQKNPFYSKAPFFSDSPYRIDPLNNHDWFAELYLVKHKPGTRTVTIYNGIQWGWKNRVSRLNFCPPRSSSGGGVIANGSSGGGGIDCETVAQPTSTPTEPARSRNVNKNFAGDNLDSQLAISDIDRDDEEVVTLNTEAIAAQKESSIDISDSDVDIANISSDLLEDPELSSEDNNSLVSKTKNTDDDALSAEAVPEPTTGLGTLLALAILPVIKRLTNRKNK